MVVPSSSTFFLCPTFFFCHKQAGTSLFWNILSICTNKNNSNVRTVTIKFATSVPYFNYLARISIEIDIMPEKNKCKKYLEKKSVSNFKKHS